MNKLKELKKIIMFWAKLYPIVTLVILLVPWVLSTLITINTNSYILYELEFIPSVISSVMLVMSVFCSVLPFYLGTVLNSKRENSPGLALPVSSATQFIFPLLIVFYISFIPFIFNIRFFLLQSFFSGNSYFLFYCVGPSLSFILSFLFWKERFKSLVLIIAVLGGIGFPAIFSYFNKYQEIYFTQIIYGVFLLILPLVFLKNLKKYWIGYCAIIILVVNIAQSTYLVLSDKTYENLVLSLHYKASKDVINEFQTSVPSIEFWNKEPKGRLKFAFYRNSDEYVSKYLTSLQKKDFLKLILSNKIDFKYRFINDLRFDFQTPLNMKFVRTEGLEILLKTGWSSEVSCVYLEPYRGYSGLLEASMQLKCEQNDISDWAKNLITSYIPYSDDEYDVAWRKQLLESELSKNARIVWVDSLLSFMPKEVAKEYKSNNKSDELSEELISLFDKYYYKLYFQIISKLVNSNESNYFEVLQSLVKNMDESEEFFSRFRYIMYTISFSPKLRNIELNLNSSWAQLILEAVKSKLRPYKYGFVNDLNESKRREVILQLKSNKAFQRKNAI